MKTLRLILSDQLSFNLASLREADKKNDVIMLCETFEEATYVKHHKQKLVFQFSAMRHFSEELLKKNYQVYYVKIDDPHNQGSLDAELKRAIDLFHPGRIELTFPGEYRLLNKFNHWKRESNFEISILEDDRFFCSIASFKDYAKNKDHLLMEYFYRMMRVKHRILVDDQGKPLGNRWNFDKENRKKLDYKKVIPQRNKFKHDTITNNVIKIVEHRFATHFGTLTNFHWAVTRKDALSCLSHFIKYFLAQFGHVQDAMSEQEPFLYHSLLSPYLNSGLLLPQEVCDAAVAAYHSGDAPLNSVEGFVRQILGWREYMRGIYWLNMPDFAQLNYFNASRALPGFYWNAETKLNCLKSVILHTQENAYSHHIQRLMVTGNFALLAGIDPKAVCEWYLIVYLDAYDWVELPNTLGMTLYGDGGLVGTKPYAASGKYIHRNSNFCEQCIYKPQEIIGDNACPFNSLYWDFLNRHHKQLQHNPRLNYAYASWKKMSQEKKSSILKQAKKFLNQLDKEKIYHHDSD